MYGPEDMMDRLDRHFDINSIFENTFQNLNQT